MLPLRPVRHSLPIGSLPVPSRLHPAADMSGHRNRDSRGPAPIRQARSFEAGGCSEEPDTRRLFRDDGERAEHQPSEIIRQVGRPLPTNTATLFRRREFGGEMIAVDQTRHLTPARFALLISDGPILRSILHRNLRQNLHLYPHRCLCRLQSQPTSYLHPLRRYRCRSRCPARDQHRHRHSHRPGFLH